MIMRRKNKNCLKKSHVQESHYDQKDQFYLKEFMTTTTKTADVGMHVNSTCIWETPQSINQSINFIYPRIYSVALKC